MSADDWDLLLKDCNVAQKYLMALFQVKTAFWTKIPWLLAGLSHADVTVARRTAKMAMQQYDQDSRPEAHHRLSVFWLQHGTMLRMQLEQFAFGDFTIQEIGRPLYIEVAKLRFLICVETTVEGRHARVASALRTRHVGPTRISLSNRLGMLERWLTRRQVQMKDMIPCFNRCRCLTQAMNVLNFDRHPLIVSNPALRKRGGPAKLHPVLMSILYNCTLENMYRPLAKQTQKDKKRKDAHRRAEEKLAGQGTRSCTKENVYRRAMTDHLGQVMGSVGNFRSYSCPAGLLDISPLSAFMSEPAATAKRPRTEADTDTQGDLLVERLPMDDDFDDGSTMHFQPVLFGLHRKKTMRLGIGVSKRFKEHQFLVSLRSCLAGFDGEVVLASRAVSARDSSPIFIVEGFRAPVDEVVATLKQHTPSRQHWTLPDCTLSAGLTDRDLCSTLGELMVQGAYPGGMCSGGIRLRGTAERCAVQLHEQSFACKLGEDRWALNDHAVRSMCSCATLLDSQPVLQLRDGIDLAQRTAFELLTLMQGQGWEWRRWVTEKQRTKKMAPIPSSYRPGDTKVFYSTLDISRLYMQALLRAEDWVAC